jgi:hypothetical protein
LKFKKCGGKLTVVDGEEFYKAKSKCGGGLLVPVLYSVYDFFPSLPNVKCHFIKTINLPVL